MENHKLQVWIEEREIFRSVLWQKLQIRFEKFAFRSVASKIGMGNTRRIYKMLQGKQWSHLLFTVDAELPEEAEDEIKKLFSEQQFFSAVNILRCAWIEKYADCLRDEDCRDLAQKLHDYLQKIGVCYEMSCAEKFSFAASMQTAKSSFKLVEGRVFEKFATFSPEEKYIVLGFAALAMEEFEVSSVEKMQQVFEAQTSLICNVSLD